MYCSRCDMLGPGIPKACTRRDCDFHNPPTEEVLGMRVLVSEGLPRGTVAVARDGKVAAVATNVGTHDPTTCQKCHVSLVKGIALKNTPAGIPDFGPHDKVCTVSDTGPPKLVEVWKCPECGYSRTLD